MEGRPMGLTLPLVLSLLAADPQSPFTSPQPEVSEYGHGLMEKELHDGWISLFDGKTSFGWNEAKVREGIISGGETTSVFGKYELKAEVISDGMMELGGEKIRLSSGTLEMQVKGKR